MTTKIIMDSDPGIDDAAALSIALNHPAFDLPLITTVAGNVTVDKTTRNALKLVDFFQRSVPVAAGAAQPLIKPFEDAARIHGESGMPGYEFATDLPAPLSISAVEALYQTIMQSATPVTLVPTGAYTNVALLFKEHPDVCGHIRQIVAMGGTLGRGNMTSAAEFNVFTDPEAAAIMYASGIPIVMVGLDVTLKALLTPTTLQKLATLGRTGEMLHALITHYGDGGAAGIPMHDVNTLFYLRHPEAFTTQAMWIDIQTSGPAIGATVGDIRGAYHHDQTNALVCTDIDASAFNQWFINQISQIG